MSAPTLSHDIEEWIKDHSHAAIYASLGRMYATHQLLEDRVAKQDAAATRVAMAHDKIYREFKKRVAVLEETIEWMRDGHFCEPLPQPPRGPHD